MAKRGPEEGLRPPPLPRAREAMVTIDLGSHVAAMDGETLTALPAKTAAEPALPFRTMPALTPSDLPPAPRQSAPPPAPLAPSSLLPSRVAMSSPAPPSAAPLAAAPPSPAPMSTAVGPSPWAGPRARHVDATLALSSADVAPPALLNSAPGPARPRTASDSALPSGSLSRHLVECLAHRAELASRLRARWRELTEEPTSSPSAADQLRAAFEPTAPPTVSPATLRRWCIRILSRASCTPHHDLRKILRDSLEGEGEAEAPLSLVTGELQLAFDELETLKATVAAAAPYVGEDEELGKVVTQARELLGSGALLGSRDSAKELIARVRRATVASEVVDDVEIGRRVERTLIAERAYARRTVLGGKRLAATLVRDGATVTCYLPEAMAESLPLYAVFPARVVGEVFHRQDQDEESVVALLVGVLGRLIEKGDD
ncbi:MAG: hypothetical protein FJ095_19610 [Deltaproteobacteria bacterium]|nr:hypothetical protein [Deltaproteobacteria bacterium]